MTIVYMYSKPPHVCVIATAFPVIEINETLETKFGTGTSLVTLVSTVLWITNYRKGKGGLSQ